MTTMYRLLYQLQLTRVIQAIGYDKKCGAKAIALAELQATQETRLENRIVCIWIIPTMQFVDIGKTIEVEMHNGWGTILPHQRGRHIACGWIQGIYPSWHIKTK